MPSMGLTGRPATQPGDNESQEGRTRKRGGRWYKMARLSLHSSSGVLDLLFSVNRFVAEEPLTIETPLAWWIPDLLP